MIHFPFSFLSVTLCPISYIGWNMHLNWCSKLLVRGFSQIMEKEVWFNELELCILLPNCCYYLAWLQYPSTAFRATKRPLWVFILQKKPKLRRGEKSTKFWLSSAMQGGGVADPLHRRWQSKFCRLSPSPRRSLGFFCKICRFILQYLALTGFCVHFCEGFLIY